MTGGHPYRCRKARRDHCLPASRPSPSRPTDARANASGAESEHIPGETSPLGRSAPCEIRVAEHAILRYLERFEGVDIASAAKRLKSRLYAGRAGKLVEFGGTSTFRIRVDGATFCVRNGQVVTCYP